MVHKLGSGAFSTVWLARDCGANHPAGPLVSLKVLSAEESTVMGTRELAISNELDKVSKTTSHPGSATCRICCDHFMHHTPRDSHLCLVSEFAGLSLDSIGRWGPGPSAEVRRLRADVARSVAKQVSLAVHFMHQAGIVHGDLTPSNVLFKVHSRAQRWADEEVYATLGAPRTYRARTPQGHVEVVKVVKPSLMATPSILQEDVFLSDFGMSFVASRKPADYEAGTQFKFMAPELLFDEIVSFASDVWALGCLICYIRSAASPFDGFFNELEPTVIEMVRTLGRLPDPWWSAWAERNSWFDEDGEIVPRDDLVVPVVKTTLREILHGIGRNDIPCDELEFYMVEKLGVPLPDEEVDLLTDLLGKMLRYRPEERLTMEEVVQHPWFQYGQ